MNQKGLAQIFLILILLAGLGLGVYLVQQKTNIFPKASVSGPVSPTTSFELFSSKSELALNIGDEIAIQVLVRSDVAAANLFDAKINYDPQVLQLGRVDVTSPFVKNWVEQYWAEPGKISLVGGVPNPGFQTRVGDTAPTMATLYFTALKAGQTTISLEDASSIYSNADNTNILVSKNNLVLYISTGTVFSPSPIPTPSITPSPTPLPSATPIPGTGDGNNDGRVNLVDLSVLLSDFNRETGFRLGIDLNGDGKINTFDFALMRNLLIEKKVIRG